MARRKKERKKKKRKKKHYLLKFTLLVVCCVCLYYFLTSDFFDVQRIKIENNKHYTKDQIVDIAKAKPGVNLFSASTKKMRTRLLKDPYIKNAKVRRILPKTIKISVEERQPYAVIPYGEEYIIIDRNCIVLEKASAPPQLPLLVGMTVKNIEPGTKLSVEQSSVLEDTLNLLDKMEDNELYFKKIDISNIIIKAYIYDQLVCEGTPDNILNNMDALKEMLYQMYSQGIQRGVIKLGDGGYIAFTPLVE